MTLYLKYRPQKLEELDLKEVRESLKKTVESGKIPHAFLFSGPKGSGKTSAARILAKVVNCENRRKDSVEPCNRCNQCKSITQGGNIDVIELDAASHRGIDDVRTLRNAVKLAPAKAKKKVYVIDEAHMLTLEASNALLKTLEEPPEHVMFILATTNPEKLIETIRSRATLIVFKKASEEEIVRSLRRKVRAEKLKVENEVLKLMAKASDGAFRDADKLLEQLITEKIPFKEKEIEEFLFQKKTIDIEKFLSLLARKETKEALNAVEKVSQAGVSMQNFLEATLSRLRGALLAKLGLEGDDIYDFSQDQIVYLIKLFSRAAGELPTAVLEQIPIEIAVVEWCEKEFKNSSGPGQRQKSKTKNSEIQIEKESRKTKNRAQLLIKKTPKKNTGTKGNPSKKRAENLSDEVWAKILSEVKPKNTSTEALLRAARPKNYDGKTLELGVFYKFHKERLEEFQHRRLLEDVVGSVLGNKIRVVCTLVESHSEFKEKVEDIINKEGNLAEEDNVLTESDSLLTETEDEDIIKVAKEIFGS